MFISHTSRFFGLFCCILALSACRDGLEPSFIPAGYTYHHEAYNSPPGPDAPSIGYDYSAELNEDVLNLWRGQVVNMVDQLEAETNLSAQRVHIEPLPYMNAFNASYDHIVRETFASRGYSLVDGNAPLHIRYEAFRPKDSALRHPYPHEANLNTDDAGPPIKREFYPEEPSRFMFVLTAQKNGTVLGQIRQENTFPAFGYEVDEGQRVPEERLRL